MTYRHLDFTYAYSFAARAVETVHAGPDAEPSIDDALGDETAFVAKIRRPSKATVLHDFVHAINFYDLDYATGHFGPEAGDDFAGLIASAGIDVP
ncbi:MAG: hypothetical protein KKA32_10325 [Actinobacteria bacterium]|nr:hypothetical protein [Actinomycetota bacterium]